MCCLEVLGQARRFATTPLPVVRKIAVQLRHRFGAFFSGKPDLCVERLALIEMLPNQPVLLCAVALVRFQRFDLVALRDLAVLAARYHGDIHRAEELRPDTIVRLFEKTDALRRPQRFEQLLQACAADFNGRLGWEDRPYTAPERLRRALTAVQAVPAGDIARGCADPAQIPERIHAARVEAVKAVD